MLDAWNSRGRLPDCLSVSIFFRWRGFFTRAPTMQQALLESWFRLWRSLEYLGIALRLSEPEWVSFYGVPRFIYYVRLSPRPGADRPVCWWERPHQAATPDGGRVTFAVI
jgi:hypothetical protein